MVISETRDNFRRCRLWIRPAGILVTVAVLIALGKMPFGQQGPSPHENRGQCNDCHLNDPKTAEMEGARTVLVADVDTLCKRCHKVNPDLSHPSMVAASRQLPGDFPLDWAGRVTCTTCHYPHRGSRINLTGYMIRTEKVGRALCGQCHGNLVGKGKSEHAAFLDKSHLESSRTDGVARALLDEASLQCLGCHDGTVAKAGSFGLPGSQGTWEHGSAIGISHPIGVEYPPRDRVREYRPVTLLDPRIRLFKGKLGCCTCHGPYSKEQHGLVMSNSGSMLCFACHMK